MNITSLHKRITSADYRAREIVEELKDLKTEYHPREVRGLTQEYMWTVERIIDMCDEILESEPTDIYGEEVDFRIKLEYFQERYEGIRDNVSLHLSNCNENR